MTRHASKTFTALSLLITAVFTSQASADTFHHIDQLAVHIEHQANLILDETRHYRHTPEYRHLVNDARRMAALAAHMHDIVHLRNHLGHLESDLAQLDAKFHHLESVFDRVERNAAYGHGHIHGSTHHVKLLLKSIERDIHHLQDDLRSLRTRHHYPINGQVFNSNRVFYNQPLYVPNKTIHHRQYGHHGHQQYGHRAAHRGHGVHGGHGVYGGQGVSFGNGKIRIRF